MTQNASDVVIDNDTTPALRTDLNNVLVDITTLHSGSSQPSSTYANMLWYDTANNILKMRNEANSGWIDLGYLDQGAGAFRILDDTQVTNTSGTQTGLLGDQSTATWEAGTGTTESLVSPAKVKAAIDALAIGDSFTGPTSRTLSTSYQNTTGKPIFVNVVWVGNTSTALSGYSMQISADSSTWITVGAHNTAVSQNDFTFSSFVPNDYYWRVIKTTGANSVTTFTSVEFY